MEIWITPSQDSDNTDATVLSLSESQNGKLLITLCDPDRKIFLDRDTFLRAYNALFPNDLKEYAK